MSGLGGWEARRAEAGCLRGDGKSQQLLSAAGQSVFTGTPGLGLALPADSVHQPSLHPVFFVRAAVQRPALASSAPRLPIDSRACTHLQPPSDLQAVRRDGRLDRQAHGLSPGNHKVLLGVRQEQRPQGAGCCAPRGGLLSCLPLWLPIWRLRHGQASPHGAWAPCGHRAGRWQARLCLTVHAPHMHPPVFLPKQDPSDKSFILADDTLQRLTGEKRFKGFSFAKFIKNHIRGYADQASDGEAGGAGEEEAEAE